MGIQQQLLTKPREASGAGAANRFDFQKDWALCLLFQLHEGTRDYVLIMEHHEDVVVLFFTPTPEKVECYQVKTRELHRSRWSVSELLKRKRLKKKLTLSILGKMYENCKVFGSAITSVNFVTNSSFTLTLKSGDRCDTRNRVCLDELAQADIDKVHAQLRAEHALSVEPTFAPIAHLHQTDLSLHDHAGHATGKLAEFLGKVKPGGAYPVPTLYRTLFDEIRRRTDYEWSPVSYDEIVKHKGLTRAQFQQMLDSLPEVKNFEAVWGTIQGQLTLENESLTVIFHLRQVCRRYEIDRMDITKGTLNRLRVAVEEDAISVRDDPNRVTLRDKLEAGVAMVAGRGLPGADLYSVDYIKAMFLMAFYGY